MQKKGQPIYSEHRLLGWKRMCNSLPRYVWIFVVVTAGRRSLRRAGARWVTRWRPCSRSTAAASRGGELLELEERVFVSLKHVRALTKHQAWAPRAVGRTDKQPCLPPPSLLPPSLPPSSATPTHMVFPSRFPSSTLASRVAFDWFHFEAEK